MQSSANTVTGQRVVVLGGGFAGLGAAYAARERLGANDTVTVVAASGHFVFAPSLTWAALGRPVHNISFALEPALEAKGIRFLRAQVEEVRPQIRCVKTTGGDLPYDRLIIATGGRPSASAIPGLAGEFQNASWIVGDESALEARNVIDRLRANPGPLVVGVAPGASYMSAAYELALALDTALRHQGIRDRVPMTFLTAEPFLGHLGIEATAAGNALERLFRERNIATRVDIQIERVRPHAVELSTGERIEAAAIVIMPPFSGDVDIWKSAGLTDHRGIIPVNTRYQHVRFPDIYAAGVASTFDVPVPPLQSCAAPHTGYLSLRMGMAAGQNVAASLGYGAPASRTLPTVLDLRVIDGGDSGLLLISRGDQTLHNTAIPLPGKTAHIAKMAIERYLLWRLRTGRMNLP